MGIHYGHGKTVNRGLVFAYDTGEIYNSYLGEPTDNLISLAGKDSEIERSGTSYPYFSANITSLVHERWSSSNGIITMSFEGKRDYVQGGTGGGNDGYPRMYVYFTDWSWSRSFGTGAYDWTYTSSTGAMPDPTNKSIYFAIYHMNSGNPGRSYSRKHQVEFKNRDTRFVNGSRTNTDSLLDLTGNGTIDLSNVNSFDDQGIIFDGTDDKMVMGTNPAWNFGTTDFTVEIVFNMEYNTTYTHFLTFGDQYTFSLKMNRNNLSPNNYRIYAYAGTNGPSTGDAIPANAILDQYNHLIFLKRGDTVSMYLDGVHQGDMTGWAAANVDGSANTMSIGNGWASEYSKGEQPVTRLYSRALTEAEIKQNFNHYKSRFGI